MIHPAPVKDRGAGFSTDPRRTRTGAESLTEPKPGVYRLRLRAEFLRRGATDIDGSGVGAKLQIRFAEVLNPDGTIYTDNLRTAKATDSLHILGSRLSQTVHATVHVPWLPLRGTDRVDRSAAMQGQHVTALVFHTDAPFTIEAQNRQRDDQPTVEQHSLGPAVELCRRADGLPAARRAARLDGRCGGLLARGQLQHGSGRLFAQVCRGYARHAGRNAVLRHLLARNHLAECGLRPGVERCGRDRSLDLVAADRRQEHHRRKLDGDGKVS